MILAKQMLHLSGDIENLQTILRQIKKAVTMISEEAFEAFHQKEQYQVRT